MESKILDPVIVTGAPRSGTTLTMRWLEANGLQVGKKAAQADLAEGRIRDEFFKPVLKSGGFDPLAQETMPPVGWRPKMSAAQARQKILDLAEVDYFSRPWGFKAIKGLLFWRLLHEAFPDAKWLLIYRLPPEHIDSLLRTPFMRAHSTREGWREYLDTIYEHAADLQSVVRPYPLGPVRVFRPSLLRDPAGQEDRLKDVIAWLGLYYNPRSPHVYDQTKYRRHE